MLLDASAGWRDGAGRGPLSGRTTSRAAAPWSYTRATSRMLGTFEHVTLEHGGRRSEHETDAKWIRDLRRDPHALTHRARKFDETS